MRKGKNEINYKIKHNGIKKKTLAYIDEEGQKSNQS